MLDACACVSNSEVWPPDDDDVGLALLEGLRRVGTRRRHTSASPRRVGCWGEASPSRLKEPVGTLAEGSCCLLAGEDVYSTTDHSSFRADSRMDKSM
mmetsp:Transcript_15565/g.62677  ORF Transcript_15565/g.62677 Transcript_15565/m.62677 type:complete len:97 (-) Transcript_15565:23-313(-)